MTVGELIWKSWAEVAAIALLIIGFLLAISMNSVAFIYVAIFLAGLLAGRYYFLKMGRRPLFPFFLIVIGFLLGYVLGTFTASRKIVAVLFFAGWVISHIAHKKGYIPK